MHGKKPAKVIVHFPQWSAEPSSMSYYCDLLVEGLTRQGHEVRIVSKRVLVDGASQPLWRMLLSKTPAVISTWPEMFRQHIKDPNNWFVNISQEYIPPFGASRSINIIHDLIQIDYPRSGLVRFFYRHLLPKLARNAALNISVSHSTALRLEAMRIPSRVVYNEFSLADCPEPRGQKSVTKKYAACWVGNISKHKNIADYLAAAAAMPDKTFAAIMPRRDSGLVGIELDLPMNVEIFHSLESKDYGELLRASNFLVSTSLVEGFGRPPAEGALAGCDIVLTDIPIFRELYDGLAHFYKPGDISSLVAVLSEKPNDIYDKANKRFKDWSEQHRLVDVIDATISSAN
jgi:glycosyltransferase involved in cell wall biosynthesis